MASPRFNGQGFTNPTNPLGFHSENRYRAEEPMGSQFMSNESNFSKEAETRVFEAAVGRLLKELIEQVAKNSVKAMGKAALKGGKLADEIMKQVAKEVETAIKKAGDDAAKAAAKAGKSVDDQAKAAMKAMDGAIDDVALGGLDDAAKASARRAGKESVSEGMEAGIKDATGGGLKKFMKNTPIKVTGTGVVGVAAGYAIYKVFGTDGPVSAWMDDLIGANCDEKAIDAGLEVGTAEYTKSVADCQKRAETKMAIFGGFCILVIGGIVFFVLR